MFLYYDYEISKDFSILIVFHNIFYHCSAENIDHGENGHAEEAETSHSENCA